MQAANHNKKGTRKLVGGLVVAAVIIYSAGSHHQRSQQDATVDWHQVSPTLMEVEGAKRELHQSLQDRIVREQETPALRKQ